MNDDEFDSFARSAGAALRRPASETGASAVRRARRHQQTARLAIGSGTAALIAVAGGISIATRDEPNSNVSGIEAPPTVIEPCLAPPSSTSLDPQMTVGPTTMFLGSTLTPPSTVVLPALPSTVFAPQDQSVGTVPGSAGSQSTLSPSPVAPTTIVVPSSSPGSLVTPVPMPVASGPCVDNWPLVAPASTVPGSATVVPTSTPATTPVPTVSDPTAAVPTPANRPPSGVDDSWWTMAYTSIRINVLANDIDPDGDPLTVLSVTPSANGTVSGDGQVVTYTPNPGFTGNDSFVYEVSDGVGGLSEASVFVVVRAKGSDQLITAEETVVFVDLVAVAVYRGKWVSVTDTPGFDPSITSLLPYGLGSRNSSGDNEIERELGTVCAGRSGLQLTAEESAPSDQDQPFPGGRTKVSGVRPPTIQAYGETEAPPALLEAITAAGGKLDDPSGQTGFTAYQLDDDDDIEWIVEHVNEYGYDGHVANSLWWLAVWDSQTGLTTIKGAAADVGVVSDALAIADMNGDGIAEITYSFSTTNGYGGGIADSSGRILVEFECPFPEES